MNKTLDCILPLDEYDVVIVSYSGGKDSLACILHLLELGVDPAKMELWHQHVDGEPGSEDGLMDWPVTESYVRATGEALGIPVFFQWKHGGFEREMCRHNEPTAPVSFETPGGVVTLPTKRATVGTRRKFPQVSADLSVRWCSAYLKIDVFARSLNNDPRFLGKKVLMITGERRQESAARSRYQEFELHRCHSGKKTVHQWRGIIDWTEEQVWEIIERHGVNPHPAYHIGFGRVSCRRCIFQNPDQWATNLAIDPEGVRKIADYEVKWGCTIKRGESVEQQAARGKSLVPAGAGAYVDLALGRHYDADLFRKPSLRPAGAFAACGGPT